MERWMIKWCELGWAPCVSYPDNITGMDYEITIRNERFRYVATEIFLKNCPDPEEYTKEIQKKLCEMLTKKIKQRYDNYHYK